MTTITIVMVTTLPAPARTRRPFLKPDNFAAIYFAKLDAAGVDRIRRELDGIRDRAGADPVPLCFEDVSSGTNWCHGVTFAKWWHRRTGERVLELKATWPG